MKNTQRIHNLSNWRYVFFDMFTTFVLFPPSMISEREWQGTKWRYKNRIKDSFHFIESVEVMEGLPLYVFVQKLTIVCVMSDSFVFSNTHTRWPPIYPALDTGHRRLTANKRGERWKIDQSGARTLIKCHWDIDNLLWMPHTIWFSVFKQLTFTQTTLRILQYQFRSCMVLIKTSAKLVYLCTFQSGTLTLKPSMIDKESTFRRLFCLLLQWLTGSNTRKQKTPRNIFNLNL